MNRIEQRIKDLGYKPRVVVADLTDTRKFHCVAERSSVEVDFVAETEEDVDNALLAQ